MRSWRATERQRFAELRWRPPWGLRSMCLALSALLLGAMAGPLSAQPAPPSQTSGLAAAQASTDGALRRVRAMEADASSRCMGPDELEAFEQKLITAEGVLAQDILLEAQFGAGVAWAAQDMGDQIGKPGERAARETYETLFAKAAVKVRERIGPVAPFQPAASCPHATLPPPPVKPPPPAEPAGPPVAPNVAICQHCGLPSAPPDTSGSAYTCPNCGEATGPTPPPATPSALCPHCGLPSTPPDTSGSAYTCPNCGEATGRTPLTSTHTVKCPHCGLSGNPEGSGSSYTCVNCGEAVPSPCPACDWISTQIGDIDDKIAGWQRQDASLRKADLRDPGVQAALKDVAAKIDALRAQRAALVIKMAGCALTCPRPALAVEPPTAVPPPAPTNDAKPSTTCPPTSAPAAPPPTSPAPPPKPPDRVGSVECPPGVAPQPALAAHVVDQTVDAGIPVDANGIPSAAKPGKEDSQPDDASPP